MMSNAICDFCWLPFFYHKDTYRIKFSRFYILWGVIYQKLSDFLHFQKCDNYVITPSNACKKFPIINLLQAMQNKSPHAKNQSSGVFHFL